jgi:hypothetical protein
MRALVRELCLEPGSILPTAWAAERSAPSVVGVDERLVWEFDDTHAPVPWVGM